MATALMTALAREDAQGKTFTLAGPRVFSYGDLYDMVEKSTYRHLNRVNLPLPLMK